MCGIWASIGFQPDRARIETVRHRGPDGEGWKTFEGRQVPVALGHRRLAIIDVSDAGLQPMSDASGRWWLVFNGEIYNYLELRAELQQLGCSFRTRTDSEVLLTGFIRWGEKVLHRLTGMFAFAVWDDVEKRLFVARDRFGIKPVYYLASSTGIAFGSEIKQLRGLPGDPGNMNLARVHDFLSNGMLDHTTETLYAGINQLRGGECVSIDLARFTLGAALPIHRWYRLPAPGTIDIAEAEAGARFRELLHDSVRLHLRSDVPVGSCLSGGLDSSSIVCLMAKLLDDEGNGARVHSVSACYDDKSVDERPFMEAVVDRARCVPAYVYPHPEDAFTLAERITWHQDEPYGSTSIFAQWSVFEEARRLGIKVMLDGQGADEQLAGYHGGFSYYYAALFRELRLVALFRTLMERRRYHALPIAQQLRLFVVPLLPPGLARLLRGHRVPSLTRRDWLASDAFASLDRSRGAFDIALDAAGLGPVRDIGDLCVAMVQASNLAMLLHWEDRNSMAHGIEARVPFLDHQLVEFTIGLGNRHKIVGGDTKRVLRRAMAGILPDTVTNRRDKLGFSTPETEWFRGPLRRSVEAGVEETLQRYPGLLDRRGTLALMRDMLSGARPIDFTLWRIVNIGIWGRACGVAA
jgi:asparagine synthase (glutamine-hydrolysing)